MHWLDLLIIAIYMFALIAMGLYFSRRQTSTEAYFVAKRSIPGWAMGLSLLATIITSVTFIAYPGAAYAGNWSMLVPGIMIIIVLLLIGTVIVPFFRQVVRMSAYEYFGKRFGAAVRYYASFAFAVGHIAKMGFVLYLLALTVGSMTQWNVDRIIVIVGAVTIFYTLLGGMQAVIWSDVMQSVVLWLGILVCVGTLLYSPPGGAHAALAMAWKHHKFSLGSTQPRLDQPTILVLAIYGFFFYVQKFTADQTVVQRYLVARTDKSAFRGVVLGSVLCIPVWTAFMFIGSLLWSFYRLTGEHLPSTIVKPDQVFPHFLVTHIPVGLAGLFVASLFGSAMSMLASDMNCLALIGVEDFYRSLRKKATDRERLRASKWMVVANGVIASTAAILLAHSQSAALALYYTVTAIVAGGLAGLFMLAFLSRRAGNTAAHGGILACLIFTIWATLTAHNGLIVNMGHWNFPWHEFTIGAIGNLLLLAVGLLLGAIFPATQADVQQLCLWGWLEKRRQMVSETK